MTNYQNITVPYVGLSQFDWSIARTGPLPWNLTLWYEISCPHNTSQMIILILAGHFSLPSRPSHYG